MNEEIKVISPYVTINENETDVAVISYNNAKFTGVKVGEELVVIDEVNVYQIRVSQNAQKITDGKYQIKGTVVAQSHNYEIAKIKYTSLFLDKEIPHIKMNIDDAYIEFFIVPNEVMLDENYRLTQGLQGSSISKLSYERISDQWDEVMNEGGYGEKVIGNERLKDEVIAAIASGKHILLYGPPGTGKTMISNRISKVFECNSKLFTANSEWTADDTVGGYTFSLNPQTQKEQIEPSNGYVTEAILECNKNASKKFYDPTFKYKGTWVIIDELNRAKMDFAFGALFTALDKDYSVLNLPQYNKYNNNKSKIFIPNTFRVIGTINNFDKNFLFKFSYALSRRFAHIYIGVPNELEFDDEIKSVLEKIKKELINEYKVNEQEIVDLNSDLGVLKVREVIAYLRGYGGKTKLRDIGTALIIDTLRMYFVQKFITNTLSDLNNMMDIAISSIIIPSLEGSIEDTSKLKNILKDYSRVIKALDEMENINY